MSKNMDGRRSVTPVMQNSHQDMMGYKKPVGTNFE